MGKRSQNRCMCFDFTQMALNIKVLTLFFCFSCFHLALFGQVRGNLGNNVAWRVYLGDPLPSRGLFFCWFHILGKFWKPVFPRPALAGACNNILTTFFFGKYLLGNKSLQHLVHMAVDLTFGAYCSRPNARPRCGVLWEVALWLKTTTTTILFFGLNALVNTYTQWPGGGEKTLRSSHLPKPNHLLSNTLNEPAH